MAHKKSDLLQAIQNTQIRIAIDRLLSLAGVNSNSVVGSAITTDVVGDLTGDVTGSATKLNPGSAPVNAVAAEGTVTLSDGITQGELLVIGADTYEFDIDETGVTEGNIAVPLVTGSVDKEDGAASLETVAAASGTADVTVVDNDDGTLTVTSATKGVIGNSIAFSKTGAHIAVDQNDSTDFLGGTTLGVDGTVGEIGTIFFDATYIYIAKAENTIADNNWRRISMGSAY